MRDGAVVALAGTGGDLGGRIARRLSPGPPSALVPHGWRTGGDQRSRAVLLPERLEERRCLITYSTVTIPPCRPEPRSARPTVSLRR